MGSRPLVNPARMSLDLFRAFYVSRPDEERWELIDGAAVMMTPHTLGHQVIAGNLQRLLSEALDKHDPARMAIQRGGVNIGPTIQDYDPEPDVVVVDAALAEQAEERYAGWFYLVAEIVSASDRVDIADKREIYKMHDACTCILTIQQARFEVRVDLRGAAGWHDTVLDRPEDPLQLDEFGLRCAVSDLYRGTHLRPRRPRAG